ncbi:MAG TPA: phosphate starvation-inducible protein PhoH [Bdellovibrionales bacterium]|nr:MAG: phosphate starvation-inducible protein PhoH [Bdellovibrionales bacterium GWB1_52_6]OFZ03709.1 MAG: phosphate starvation-inducible protein PhoH [Bdellovibrionales bacterium GWA1_52_35]OFZ41141.1 MAG: phosphate starvation-inducible protein PhoH [Bdellovibrionales bacterium GWC1_52_8]HAR41706.1 phosphate starvation-inducible protein PhoH [Bdellovibrionales bacterium]HCM38779.1 phosphate starvation-inducible protein PhoH [Bdellovibrionales bacterium]
MRKAFVIDTNVLLFDPQAIYKFANNDVMIPIVVIEEIDRFKRDMSENGRHARLFSRLIDDMRKGGELSKGVKLPAGGLLTVELGGHAPLPEELAMDKADNRILALAISLKKDNPKRPVIFVTKDTNLRIKADALGITAEDYEPSSVEPDQLYAGTVSLNVDAHRVDEFYQNKRLALLPETEKLKANQYIILKDAVNPNHTAMGRYSKELDCIVPIFKPVEGLWGIFPKNAEQAFAIDALLNDEIKLVSLVGKAGTGKTLLAIAAGLAKTVDEGVYHRLLVSRPIFPLGKDIGFLPGDIEEKLNPWMQPIYDNIDFLFGATGAKGRRGAGKGCQELMNQGLLQIEPLTYIRGRSIPSQYLIVDEAQNLTPHEIKTIVTRAGDNTKVVLTGDSFQIDNPYVDSANNGLVYLVDRFKEEAISAHITLTRGERSKLSELASNLL